MKIKLNPDQEIVNTIRKDSRPGGDCPRPAEGTQRQLKLFAKI